MAFEQLKLSNQICFPVYAASRLIIREYQPYLDNLGLTYPQYLVLLVLWEKDGLTVNEITQKLILNTNTITPLLKRMEAQGLISRTRSTSDERKVVVSLTQAGLSLQEEAASIPEHLIKGLKTENITLEEIIDLRDKLNLLIHSLTDQEQA